MFKGKFFLIFSILFITIKIFAASYEIGADNLMPYMYKDSPQNTFALNGKNIRIMRPGCSLHTVWHGHKITPSANVLRFNAKSLTGTSATFNISIRMSAYHTDPAEKCNGKAKMKYFSFRTYTQPSGKDFFMPLTINTSELRCQQCNKQLTHATFSCRIENLNEGGIEFTPFSLQSGFHAVIDRKKDNKSPHLSNIFSPGYKPYEMKKLPDHNIYSDNVLVMSQKANSINSQYKSFRTVLELWQKKDYKNAVAQAEKIAKDNKFCSIFLYLLYSRGYCDFKIDYQKAAKYFDTLIGSYYGREPGYMFWQYEYKNIWKRYRLVPAIQNEKVTINAWDNSGFMMREIVPLRGKYPLKKCYEENMRNIGGIAARTLFLIGREQTALQAILDDAKKFGSAEAWAGIYSPFDSRTLKPERTMPDRESINKPSDIEFKNLKKSAELGFIPAKLHLARVLLTKNFSPQGFDIAKARQLLAESITECEKYSTNGCKHAETDLQYARELLAVIPAANSAAADLVKLHDKLQQEKANGVNIGYADFKINIVTEMLAVRNDNPDSLLQQALKLPNSQYKKKNEMIRSAAKKGSRQAIQICLMNIVPRNDREYWHFLFLAGKYKLPYNGYQQNYFNESYQILQQLRFQMPPDEYFKAISTLAPHHARANAEFKKLSVKLEFDIAVSPNNSLKAAHVNQGGRHSLVINAQPSNEARYITVKNKSSEKIQGSIFFFSRSQECSNLSVYGEFKDEQGRTQKTYSGNFVPMKFIPAELKIFIAPRKTPLELNVQIMIK